MMATGMQIGSVGGGFYFVMCKVGCEMRRAVPSLPLRRSRPRLFRPISVYRIYPDCRCLVPYMMSKRTLDVLVSGDHGWKGRRATRVRLSMSVYDREGQGVTCTVRLHMASRINRVASSCGRIVVSTPTRLSLYCTREIGVQFLAKEIP